MKAIKPKSPVTKKSNKTSGIKATPKWAVALQPNVEAYLELECGTKPTAITLVDTIKVAGHKNAVFSAKTGAVAWWVIGGSLPMNLYRKERFASAEEAFAYHVDFVWVFFNRQHSKRVQV